MIEATVSFLVLVLGVPVRVKYYWQGSRIKRTGKARDVSRKFYLASWIIYILQFIRNIYQGDPIDVIFWAVGMFTVAYAIRQAYAHWHEPMPFWRWVIDSFQGDEEGGIFK